MSVYYSDDHVTLYHGDCLELTAWLEADVLVTDPPYGMAFRSGMGGHHGDCRVAGDEDLEVRGRALDLWGKRPAIVFGRWDVPIPAGARARLIWDKGNHVGMGDLSLPWKPNTEDIYVLGQGFAGHRGSSVIRSLAVAGTAHGAHQGRNHPTEKPPSLLEVLIEKCPPGAIADPFAGSGSTLIAARNLGRRVIGVEIEERYCEVIARRLAQDVLDFGGVS